MVCRTLRALFMLFSIRTPTMGKRMLTAMYATDVPESGEMLPRGWATACMKSPDREECPDDDDGDDDATRQAASLQPSPPAMSMMRTGMASTPLPMNAHDDEEFFLPRWYDLPQPLPRRPPRQQRKQQQIRWYQDEEADDRERCMCIIFGPDAILDLILAASLAEPLTMLFIDDAADSETSLPICLLQRHIHPMILLHMVMAPSPPPPPPPPPWPLFLCTPALPGSPEPAAAAAEAAASMCSPTSLYLYPLNT
jgi:hypothetical protein